MVKVFLKICFLLFIKVAHVLYITKSYGYVVICRMSTKYVICPDEGSISGWVGKSFWL